MKNIEFNSIQRLRDAEGWLFGRLELRCVVYFYDPIRGRGDFRYHVYTEKREEFRTCSWGNCETIPFTSSPNLEYFGWFEDRGYSVVVEWFEDNGGREVTVSVGVKIKLGPVVEIPITVSVPLSDIRTEMGTVEIYRCENTNKTYFNNWLSFKMMPSTFKMKYIFIYLVLILACSCSTRDGTIRRIIRDLEGEYMIARFEYVGDSVRYDLGTWVFEECPGDQNLGNNCSSYMILNDGDRIDVDFNIEDDEIQIRFRNTNRLISDTGGNFEIVDDNFFYVSWNNYIEIDLIRID